MQIRVYGLARIIQDLKNQQDGIDDAIKEASIESAEYIQDCILDKFGQYQPGWEKLKYETVVRKRKRGFGANANKPLVMSGDMMMSIRTFFYKYGKSFIAGVRSDDKKFKFHIYGAPGANVPVRDPVRPVVKEESEEAVQIFRDRFEEEMDKL